jgi:hypothetical protein
MSYKRGYRKHTKTEYMVICLLENVLSVAVTVDFNMEISNEQLCLKARRTSGILHCQGWSPASQEAS